MNWKNRLKNYNFWISIFSAVLLILQALKIEFDIAYVNEIFTAVLGLLVVIGIISDPTKAAVKTQEQTEIKSTQTKSLPVVNEDEANNGNLQNDFQTVVNDIKKEIRTAMEAMKVEKEATDIKNNIEEPVVAEKTMENPYVDVIN